jgi:NAD-dependent deacetylase
LHRLRRSDPVVVLTGAGISKESGLDTFRDPDGIWMRVRLEDVATPEAFARDPARVHEFYNARRRALHDPAIRPNAAHEALARLERDWPGPFLLVTQNVDDLHDRAGGSPLHMHGEIAKVRCLACGAVRGWRQDLTATTRCPACGAVGRLRPDVVWFGEMPFAMERIEAALDRCRLFVAIGTSGLVYPAAGLVHRALDAGALTAELNLAATPVADLFELRVEGPATRTVPALVEALLALP